MRVEVDISSNVAQVIAQISAFSIVAKERVIRELKKSALNVQRGAKQRCPVKTGRLRSSIQLKELNNGLTITVGTDVIYAPFVEFGTSRRPPKPYLNPAAEDERVNLEAAIRGALNP